MTIKLTFREKLYLVGLGGDVPDAARKRLLSLGTVPSIAAALAEGRRMVQYFDRIYGGGSKRSRAKRKVIYKRSQL